MRLVQLNLAMAYSYPEIELNELSKYLNTCKKVQPFVISEQHRQIMNSFPFWRGDCSSRQFTVCGVNFIVDQESGIKYNEAVYITVLDSDSNMIIIELSLVKE